MFTGIVQEIGTVRAAEDAGAVRRLTIAASRVLERAREGDSIAVDGVCLTVVHHDTDAFMAEAIPVTLEHTTLGALRAGDRVNLEGALAAGDPLGGHIVQGHVDGVGDVVAVRREGETSIVDVAVPAAVSRVTVLRGSIALNGVSLTVSALPEPGVVRVSLVPYTLAHTTLGELVHGARVNLEADLVAKLVAEQTKRWLDARGDDAGADVRTGPGALGGGYGIR